MNRLDPHNTSPAAEMNSPPSGVQGGVKGAMAFWSQKEAKSSPEKGALVKKKIVPVKKTTYLNSDSLYLEPISSFRKDELIEIRGYALVADEIVEMMKQGEGIFEHPYTKEKLNESERELINTHPKVKAQIEEIKQRAARMPKNISEATLVELKDFATLLARYGLNLFEEEIGDKEFSSCAEAKDLLEFENYYSGLSDVEREALNQCKVGYFTFEEMYDQLKTGAVCRREIGKDLWKLLGKIGPHLLPDQVLKAVKRRDDAFLHDYIPE